MEDLSEQMSKGLICPRCGRQMYILTPATERCAFCGFWRKMYY